MSDCGHECHRVGGPFIAEDPDCPIHGTDAQARERAEERRQAEEEERAKAAIEVLSIQQFEPDAQHDTPQRILFMPSRYEDRMQIQIQQDDGTARTHEYTHKDMRTLGRLLLRFGGEDPEEPYDRINKAIEASNHGRAKDAIQDMLAILDPDD